MTTLDTTRVGPRRKIVDKEIWNLVNKEFEEAEELKMENTVKEIQASFSTTYEESYIKPDFEPSLVENDPSIRISTFSSDYQDDPAVTFYSYDLEHNKKSLPFPTSPVRGLNPFNRNTNFSADIKNPVAYPSETYAKPLPSPTLREHRDLQNIRDRVIKSISSGFMEPVLPGDVIRSITQQIRQLRSMENKEILSLNHFIEFCSREWNVFLSERELYSFRAVFDAGSTSSVVRKEVIELFRGKPLKHRSAELVDLAFLTVSENIYEAVPEELIRRRLQSDHLNQYLNGTIPSHDVVELFINGLKSYILPVDSWNSDHQLKNELMYTRSSFLEYYRDVYSELPNDVTFEELLRTSWGF